MKIFRLWGLVLFIVTLVIFIFSYNIYADRAIKFSLEKTFSALTFQTVKIKNVNFSLFDLKLGVNDFKIINKDKKRNVLYIKYIVGDIEANPLISFKKYNFEKLIFEDVSFNLENLDTKYKDSTNSKKETEREKSLSIPKISITTPNIEEILKKEENNLETPKLADKFKSDIEEKLKYWKNQERKLKNLKVRYEVLQTNLKQLNKEAKNIKSPDDLSRILSKAKEIEKQLKELKSTVKTYKEKLNEDKMFFQQAYNSLNKAIKKDISYLKKKYSLNQKGALNLIGTLFGEKIKDYLEKGIFVYKTISPFLKKGEEKQKELEKKSFRLSGRYVEYRDLTNYPDFLIKEGKLSINLFDTKIYGEIKDLSDNQKKYQKPVFIKISSNETDKFESLKAKMIFDRTANVPKDYISTKILNLKLSQIKLSKNIEIIPKNVNLDLEMDIKDESILNGNIKLQFNNVNFKIYGSSNIEKLIKEVLNEVNRFYVSAIINGNVENPKMVIKTDIDEILNKKLKSVFQKKAKAFNKQLESKGYNYLSKYIKDLDSYNKYFNSIGSNIPSIDNIKTKLTDENYLNKLLKENLKGNLIRNIKLPF